jgi:SAM-dependent methyltransferase
MNVDLLVKKLEEIIAILKEGSRASNQGSIQTPQDSKPESKTKPETKPETQPTAATFEALKDLLGSGQWPQAAPDFLICEESDKDKYERAEGILAYMGQDIKGKKFLDFGCGEGHVAQKAVELGAESAIGYDTKQLGGLTWDSQTGNCLLTTDIEKAKAGGPYDLILLYDVLDHSEDPVNILATARDMLAPQGRIYVRCHPISSRHATHLYKKINKAYIHLVFTDDELKQLGYENDIKQRTYFPQAQGHIA